MKKDSFDFKGEATKWLLRSDYSKFPLVMQKKLVISLALLLKQVYNKGKKKEK